MPARRRGIGAIRVSKERDGMTSPENQRYAIEQFAERENIEIVEWIEGIDESGSRNKSAWWARLSYGCDRIEAKAADTLVVWRIDRTARHRLKWAITQDRIESAGGLILSATEPNDQSPAGRYGRGMMIEHAVYVAESIGATWKETLERRVRHGLTPNGQRHFGYAYTRERGYEIDPIEGPILASMYRDYTAGDSALQIAERLSGPVARPAEGEQYARYARWNTPAILRLLDSGFGAGLILFRGDLHDGAHEPVIDADEWARYRAARDARRRRPRAERSPYTYSGILFCHCGSRMSGRTDHGRPRYACIESATYRVHADASLAAHVIDAEVLKWLNKIRDRLNKAAQDAPRRPVLVANPTRDISQKIAAERERLDNATARYFDNPEVVSEDAYQRYRAASEAKIAAWDAELTRASAQATVRPLAFVGDLVERWPDLPIERRREALRLLVDRITINPPNTIPRVVVDSPLTRT
ncbi:recombinase family protein [Microbacterium allomyrinae]|uniref:Recombinase family protein n=1 Tax=Microbacterium allomyrinae TaxID=2830666 RepID=A0A9X1LRC1_9MICO|nr:recombinase family protein [Microbacterium allomyrinae]MCC2030652.1 recombinase family protein [Microbacterium allomyrinae]